MNSIQRSQTCRVTWRGRSGRGPVLGLVVLCTSRSGVSCSPPTWPECIDHFLENW